MNFIPGGYCSCPLCAGIIKKVLPHEDGKEVDKYWAWVEEVNPSLPTGFMRNFRHSAHVIETVFSNLPKKKADSKSKACVIT